MSGWGETPPGSQKAQNAGCTCPVTDNHYGAGIPHTPQSGMYNAGTAYWINADCPLHGKKENE